ncbi:MAG: LytTR family DNA-binding domain-containing protein [Imperialibacter sp.]|uniref:LytR/AlgR family response regulator transcription factor n=1 Tax=Imperialibacter sp. TaxID=2038411 RepID=UPI0032EF7A9C
MEAIIVDDEAPLREALKALLKVSHPDIRITGEADSVSTGFQVISTKKPDLVFLDVEINEGTGFDLLSKFETIDFKIIFVTAHNEYAIRAFKFSAVDYLLKPVDPGELNYAVSKARESVKAHSDKLSLKLLLENSRDERLPKRVLLKDHDSIHLIETDEIVRCEAEGNYTKFYLANGKFLLISKTLKDFDSLFSSNQFFRAHQSHLVNLKFFLRLDKADGGSIVLKDGTTLPVATRKKEHLMGKLAAYTK